MSGASKSVAARTNAVVVGGGLGGLGIVRSLAPQGVACHLVVSAGLEPAAWSRFCRPVTLPTTNGEALIEGLLRLRRSLDHNPVLLTADEIAVLTISAYRKEIESSYLFHLPPDDLVISLFNKSHFHRLATQRRWRTPPTVVLTCERDLEAIEAIRFPAVAKLADKMPFHMGRGPALAYVPNSVVAKDLCRDMLSYGGDVVLQSWIPGSDDNIFFSIFHCAEGGILTSFFAGRKLRSIPQKTGGTLLCTAAQEAAPAIRKMTEQFLHEIGYAGVGGLEFKWDAQAQEYLIIEPTVARFDVQHEIATLSGTNVVLAAFNHEIRLPVPPCKLRADRAWRSNWLDARGIARHLGGRLIVYDGYLRASDPAPGLAYYLHRIIVAIINRLRRLVLRVPTHSTRP
jgi:predicted ATP-grasp superfamily ATP-dependent carboligase